MPKKDKRPMDETSDDETLALPIPVAFPNPSALKDSSTKFARWISEAREGIAQTTAVRHAEKAILLNTQNDNDAVAAVPEDTEKSRDDAALSAMRQRTLALRNLEAYRERQRDALSGNTEHESKDTDHTRQNTIFMDPEWARQVRCIVDKHIETEILKKHAALNILERSASSAGESQKGYARALTSAIESFHGMPNSPAAAGKATDKTGSKHTAVDAIIVDAPAKIAKMRIVKYSKSEQATIDRIQKERESILEVYRRTGDVTHKFSVAWIEKYHPNGFPLWKGSSKRPKRVDESVQFDEDIDENDIDDDGAA